MASEFWYPGASYPIESDYSKTFTGYSVSPHTLGVTTDARTANQLGEVARKLNIGGTTIEAGAMSPEVMESIPDQHLDEIRRLSKLTNTDITFHAPTIEPSGFTKEGWSEANRQWNEKQMIETVARAKKLTKDSPIPVTFHTTAGIGEGLIRAKEKGEEVIRGMTVIDPSSGEKGMIGETERFFPGEKREKFDPVKELDTANRQIWLKKLNNVTMSADKGLEHLEQGKLKIVGAGGKLSEGEEGKLIERMVRLYDKGKKMSAEELADLKERNMTIERGMIKDVGRSVHHSQINLMDSYNGLKQFYDQVYKEISETAKKVGEEGDKARKDLSLLNNYASDIAPLIKAGIQDNPTQIEKFSEDVIEKGISVLKNITPKIYRPLDEFATENASKTFGNVAWETWKDAKPEEREKLPVISIENPPVGAGLSRAEDVANVIKNARKQFVNNAVNQGKLSEGEAKKVAEKMIGATWDVGHINMMRKYGYDKADIVKETEKIKPFLKHVHLSDNFGFEHTELPMGMGNVPLKEMLQKLGKGEKDVKKIMETFQWYQFFKTNPFRQTLEGVRAPIYGMRAPPYWSQASQAVGSYGTGYGNIFPEQHFSMYGGGFSTLPVELGGQVQQKGSKFSGTPME